MSTFAITFTVKNEERILPFVLPLAFAMGASRVYLYFDGTSDRSREIAAAFRDVVTSNSVTPEKITDRPAWIDEISSRWEQNMDVRKRINTYFAAGLASKEGIDWLLCTDPDEVMVPQLDVPLVRGSIGSFLAEVPPDIDQVLLRNYEVAPRKLHIDNPFLECTTFYNRFPATDFVWRCSKFAFRKVVRDPRIRGWFDHCLYSARFGCAYPQLMREPSNGSAIPRGYYIGYWNHKPIIRTTSAPIHTFNIHRWQRCDTRLSTIKRGALLHYDLFDCEYALEKFRQRPPANSFNGDYHRNTIARLARDGSAKTFEEFFEQNILIKSNAYAERLEDRRILRSVVNVASLWKAQHHS